jgi:hypothetical protein
MSWSRGKPTREFLLTPRPCTKCGQHMSKEFLEERERARARKVSESLKASGRWKKQTEEIK